MLGGTFVHAYMDNMKNKNKFNYSNFTKTVVEGFTVTTFCVVFILEIFNIFSRYTMIGHPMMWVEDFAKYIFIWITFSLWHLCDRKKAHFVVDIIQNRFSRKGRKYLELIKNIIIVFFLVILTLTSIKYISITMVYSTCSFSWLPMGVIYIVIPIGSFLTILERIKFIRREIKQWYQ